MDAHEIVSRLKSIKDEMELDFNRCKELYPDSTVDDYGYRLLGRGRAKIQLLINDIEIYGGLR